MHASKQVDSKLSTGKKVEEITFGLDGTFREGDEK